MRQRIGYPYARSGADRETAPFTRRGGLTWPRPRAASHLLGAQAPSQTAVFTRSFGAVTSGIPVNFVASSQGNPTATGVPEAAGPSGSVTFWAGSTPLCTVNLFSVPSGSCTSSAAPVGTDTITGMYSGGQSTPSAALRYQHATDSRDKAIADGLAALARSSASTDPNEKGHAADTDAESDRYEMSADPQSHETSGHGFDPVFQGRESDEQIIGPAQVGDLVERTSANQCLYTWSAERRTTTMTKQPQRPHSSPNGIRTRVATWRERPGMSRRCETGSSSLVIALPESRGSAHVRPIGRNGWATDGQSDRVIRRVSGTELW